MNNNIEFLEQQKSSLLKEKAKIESEIQKLKKYPDYGNDEEDNLQELNDYESNLIIDNKFEDLLTKINNALNAIDNGTYGQCKRCQEGIETGRLTVMPWADVCVKCVKEPSRQGR